jgi:hypothetical protein
VSDKRARRPVTVYDVYDERLRRMPDPSHPDEGIKTDIEPPKLPATARDEGNYRRLAKQAGVRSFESDAPLLLDLTRDYVAAVQRQFRDECDPDGARQHRLHQLLRLRKQARELGADLAPDLQLQMYDALSERRHLTKRQWPRYVLSVYVESLEEIWREHGGGDKQFAEYNKNDGKHDGPLIWLLDELLEQIGVPTQDRPTTHTVFRAWQVAKERRQQAAAQQERRLRHHGRRPRAQG